MIKKNKSTPFSSTRIQNSHQVAFDGNSNVKQRRGWSSKNRSSSQSELSWGTHFEVAQITNLNIQGNPVLPMMIRKDPSSRGRMAVWKLSILSAVTVKPKSVNIDAGVKMPHQLGATPLAIGTPRQGSVCIIQGSRMTIPNR